MLATPDGTARYARAHPEAAPGHWRDALGLRVSSIGFGSYLGDMTDAADAAYAEAFAWGIQNGVNVLDTAANYRGGRSERAVGRAIRASMISRDQLVVATKGGFVPFDPSSRENLTAWFRTSYVDPGIATEGDLVRGSHVMTARYLAHAFDASLEALGLDGIDLYLIHNPETQLSGGIPRRTFETRLRDVFAMLEERRADGRLGHYGLATWNGLRVHGAHPEHLPLERLLEIAHEVGGDAHGFRALELPYSLAMPEAAALPTQTWRGKTVPVLDAAEDAGMLVLGSASLHQTRLFGRIAPELVASLGAVDDATAALQFARSTKGLTSALVGTGTLAHAKANAAARTLAPHPEAAKAVIG